jgi:hypothetical protein
MTIVSTNALYKLKTDIKVIYTHIYSTMPNKSDKNHRHRNLGKSKRAIQRIAQRKRKIKDRQRMREFESEHHDLIESIIPSLFGGQPADMFTQAADLCNRCIPPGLGIHFTRDMLIKVRDTIMPNSADLCNRCTPPGLGIHFTQDTLIKVKDIIMPNSAI